MMRVGFIGMGAMGSRMAGRLLGAHHDVVVYNRTPERTRPLEQRGAKVVATASELAAGGDNVVSCGAKDAPLAEVVLGPDPGPAGGAGGVGVLAVGTGQPPPPPPERR